MADVKYDIKKDGPRDKDLNKDGTVTDAERKKYNKRKAANEEATTNNPNKDQQDKLNAAQMEQRFGFAKKVVFSNPELKDLWKQAIKEQWEPAMFESQLRGTDWYKNNAEYARKAWAAKQTGGADWDQQLQDAGTLVAAQATKMGARLSSEQQAALAERFIMEGWGDPNRRALMEKEMAAFISNNEGFMRGAAGDLQEEMSKAARRNGLQFSPGYFEAAARSVASGLTTGDDWMREIREQAASKWPTFSDRIMSGLDMEDLASGYINTMANVWEVSPDSITLDDPYIRQALQGINEKGEPSMESLWDFEYRLKSDPKWTQTKNGANEVASVGMDILRRMGFQS